MYCVGLQHSGGGGGGGGDINMQAGGWRVLGEGSLLVRVFVRFGSYYYHYTRLNSSLPQSLTGRK